MNYVIFGLILITVIWFMTYNIDFSSFLLDYVRVTKILHRMGLINIPYPLLVRTFFDYFHNLLQTGEDYLRDEVDKHQNNFRGRLSIGGVPIFPHINFQDKYLIYLVILITYFAFSQVAKYTTRGIDAESRH